MSLAGAVRWTLSSSIFKSMVSVGAPGMANSTTSLWFSPSAYATVSGATFIRNCGTLAPSFSKPGFPRWEPPDPLDGLIWLMRSYIRTERKTRFKTIQVDVVPTIARDHHTRVLPTLPLPGFGTSVRTVPVRHAAPSSFLAYYPVTQPVPGTSLSPSIRSRIAANNLRGTATSAIWNVTALERETTLAPILISFSRNVVKLQCFTPRGSAICRRKLPRLCKPGQTTGDAPDYP